MNGSCILVARQGDLEAFNRLVLEHQDLVYNLAYRMLGNPWDASDATQEAFLLAYRNLSAYRGGSFRAWILRIATNLCYVELRRRQPHRAKQDWQTDEEIDHVIGHERTKQLLHRVDDGAVQQANDGCSCHEDSDDERENVC
ncbi:MAG TPA: sigma-70 family RNA polymerase sigma factor [Anaerolineales bacterium]|nr:sigma-70 family RNA polymerase sigma factor [Anaerolineales bacterium]